MKNSYVFLIVLLFTIVSLLRADVRWYDGNPDDHYWSNPYNWGALGHVPTTADGIVFVKPGLSATYGRPAPGSDPVINAASPNVASIYVGDIAPGFCELTIIDGGSISVTDRVRLGGYIATFQNPITHGRLNMEGGTLNVLGSDGIQLSYKNSVGEINMTGGIINTTKLWMKGKATSNSTAIVNLLGGTMNVGIDQWDTTAIDDRPYNRINITEGTLITGRMVSSWYEIVGLIVAYDGHSTCNFDTTTISGSTIITANPYYKAYSPTPVDEFTVSSEDVGNIILQWKPGTGAVSHDVYIGRDISDVIDGTGDTYLGRFDETTLEVGNLSYNATYYWRVDEVNGTDVYNGDVWTFSTMPYSIENSQLEIEALIIDTQRRVSRTSFEYDLRIKVKNTGYNIDSSELNLVEYPANIVILNTEPITTGSLLSGNETVCDGILTLRIDRSVQTDTDKIKWGSIIQSAIGGQNIEIVTSDINLTTFASDGIGQAELYEIANSWLWPGLADVNGDGIVNYEDLAVLGNQ